MSRVVLAAAVLLASSQEATLVVELADGGSVEGTAPLAAIRITSDFGEVSVELSRVKSIALGQPDLVTTATATVQGKVDLESLVLKTASGTVTLGRAKIRSITVKAVGGAKKGPELAPAAVIRLSAAVGEILLSRDRAWLYVLNASEGKLLRVDAARKALDPAAVTLEPATEGMCLTPDGSTLYAYSSVNGHQFASTATRPPAGKIQIVDAAAFRLKSTFAIDYDPCDAETNGSVLYLAPGSDQGQPVAVVDPARQSIVARGGRISRMRTLKLHPDGKRLYHSEEIDVACLTPPADLKGPWASYDSPYHAGPPLGTPFIITPDGKYLVAGTGTVLRLGATPSADLRLAAKIGEHLSAAMDKGGDSLFVGSTDGQLRRYSYPDFVLRQSWALAAPAYRLAVDGRTVYAALDASKRATSRAPSGVGDLHLYTLPAWSDPPGRKAAEPSADEPRLPGPFTPQTRKNQKCPLCEGSKRMSARGCNEAGEMVKYEATCLGCAGRGVADLRSCRPCRGTGRGSLSILGVVSEGAILATATVPCGRCGGDGWVIRSALEEAFAAGRKTLEPCIVCQGTKKWSYTVTRAGERQTVKEDCPACRATGRLKIVACAECKGGGTMYLHETVVVEGQTVTIVGSCICFSCRGVGYQVEP